jgi:hypothetical protein
MSQKLIDDRPKQTSLGTETPRAEKETRIDRGSSDEFADDRRESENSPDPGKQGKLGIDRDDPDQLDLTGDVAGTEPEWSE